MKRFQECNKIGKLWRYRWYLQIPFKWVWATYVKPLRVYKDEFTEDGFINHTDNYDIMTGKNLWSLLIGDAQFKMMWYHTHEEVMDNFKNYKNDRNG